MHHSTGHLHKLTQVKLTGKLYIQSICLRQVIHSCSCLYQVLDTLELANIAMILFADQINTNRIHPVLFDTISPDMYSLTKDGKDRFILISMFEWFKRCYILPVLQEILVLEPIQLLIQEIEIEIRREDTHDSFVNAIDKHTKNAAESLGIVLNDARDSGILASFVLTAHQWSEGIRMSSMTQKKALMTLQLLVHVLGWTKSLKNVPLRLKRILQHGHECLAPLASSLIQKKFHIDPRDLCSYVSCILHSVGTDLRTNSPSDVITTGKIRNSNHQMGSKNETKSYSICTRSSEKKKQLAGVYKENLPPKKRLSKKHVQFSTDSIERKLANEFNEGPLSKKRRVRGVVP